VTVNPWRAVVANVDIGMRNDRSEGNGVCDLIVRRLGRAAVFVPAASGEQGDRPDEN
jgi:hypothetical protein